MRPALYSFFYIKKRSKGPAIRLIAFILLFCPISLFKHMKEGIKASIRAVFIFNLKNILLKSNGHAIMKIAIITTKIITPIDQGATLGDL